MIRGGAGMYLNMDASEVIVNRANEILGDVEWSDKHLKASDHVNRSQSANNS